MKYAIIAAGEGSRLYQEGILAPKPLVEVGGEKLIDRLIRIFAGNDASEILIICNTLTTLVADHLEALQHKMSVTLRIVQKTTPSSMHSMFELSPWLCDEPFVLTTVDTIFREDDFTQYVGAFTKMLADGSGDGLMGVTDYIDDEKPLYVDTDESLDINAFLDKQEHPHYISGGIYGLTPRSIDTLRACIARGESRMRNFQRALLSDGLHIKAFPFTKVLDIDHASDIQKAEAFLKEQ